MPIVGTAGHVDHGKSTLIEALTGRDPDRWAEEKRRGLTIDLGFAWTEVEGFGAVGFVDVPGHERFIKNMLAGIDAVDVALFVVAADEGWMPQSEEHLAVLDLLGIDSGVIALTRSDLVDDETLEVAQLEIIEEVEGSVLEGTPIIAVSAPNGAGIDELKAEIASALHKTRRIAGNRPRMWVDRAFSIDGAGTVVTGTLIGGSLAVGDQVEILPRTQTARIRTIQSHEASVDQAAGGTRVALNLAGISRDAVGRGSMIGSPGTWRTTKRFVADLRSVRRLDEPVRNRGSFHLHVGSGSWPARIQLLEGDELTDTGAAVVQVSDPIPLQVGDRLVLREVGRRSVVAGGRVLDPAPSGRSKVLRRHLEGLRRGLTSPDDSAAALLEVRGISDIEELAADSGGGVAADGVRIGELVASRAKLQGLTEQAAVLTSQFHEQNPLRPGIPRASLASQLNIELGVLDQIVRGTHQLVDDESTVKTQAFSGDLDESAQADWKECRDTLSEAGLAPPRLQDLPIDEELLHALVRRGSVIRISPDLVYLPATLDEVTNRISSLDDGFTVADFRDALGITRKHAVPLLEWLDSSGVTRRSGDGRAVRP